ncbi:DDB1- and CUL4-associated factor 10-like [Antedon mediterranea]|uniref:DDB1- and CUL4-associated factor 10-like n=1 Tax=Antedon mediterranea TaxID=105859 RepID=UPI003AF8C3D0
MTSNLGLGLGQQNKTDNFKAIEWLRAREIGLAVPMSTAASTGVSRPRNKLLSYDPGRHRARTTDSILRKLYQKLSNTSVKDTSYQRGFGSIFNLEFSPDGRVLVAACERRAMILFDPLTARPICNVKNAHTDCVNCVTFFDDRTFASGSDDNTIALWDIRNTKSKVRSFEGHTNWVKSIEFHRPTNQMVSSGFDGSVLLWDINKYVTDDNVPIYDELLNFRTLMRMRLTADGTKMLLSSASGLYVVIHDLNLEHLMEDMEGIEDFIRPVPFFQEELEHGHIFYRKRNRVEVVNDFPNYHTSEYLCISSLIVHPQGWNMISRMSTDDDNLEYTCVHDIQDNYSTIALHEEGKEFFECHGYHKPFKVIHSRLLYYIDEPSDGKGYIKELSVSPDGRLICSSFGYGVRLLAFNTGLSELCDIKHSNSEVSPRRAKLHEVTTMSNHRQTVLTSAFSPNQCLLVSGCLNGRVVFYNPRL